MHISPNKRYIEPALNSSQRDKAVGEKRRMGNLKNRKKSVRKETIRSLPQHAGSTLGFQAAYPPDI